MSIGMWTDAVRPESCVDEKTMAVEHFITVLLSYIRRPGIRAHLETYHDDGEGFMYGALVAVLRKAGCHTLALVDTVCCHKLAYILAGVLLRKDWDTLPTFQQCR